MREMNIEFGTTTTCSSSSSSSFNVKTEVSFSWYPSSLSISNVLQLSTQLDLSSSPNTILLPLSTDNTRSGEIEENKESEMLVIFHPNNTIASPSSEVEEECPTTPIKPPQTPELQITFLEDILIQLYSIRVNSSAKTVEHYFIPEGRSSSTNGREYLETCKIIPGSDPSPLGTHSLFFQPKTPLITSKLFTKFLGVSSRSTGDEPPVLKIASIVFEIRVLSESEKQQQRQRRTSSETSQITSLLGLLTSMKSQTSSSCSTPPFFSIPSSPSAPAPSLPQLASHVPVPEITSSNTSEISPSPSSLHSDLSPPSPSLSTSLPTIPPSLISLLSGLTPSSPSPSLPHSLTPAPLLSSPVPTGLGALLGGISLEGLIQSVSDRIESKVTERIQARLTSCFSSLNSRLDSIDIRLHKLEQQALPPD